MCLCSTPTPKKPKKALALFFSEKVPVGGDGLGGCPDVALMCALGLVVFEPAASSKVGLRERGVHTAANNCDGVRKSCAAVSHHRPSDSAASATGPVSPM
jgi:hypothetical protein